MSSAAQIIYHIAPLGRGISSELTGMVSFHSAHVGEQLFFTRAKLFCGVLQVINYVNP